MAKNKAWTVVKILLAVAAIGVAAYAIYRKFFQKKVEAELESADPCDTTALDVAEEPDTEIGETVTENALEVPAESVIANAEAMEA